MLESYDEILTRTAYEIGRSKVRRAVYSEVYGRGSKPRTISEITAATGMPLQSVRNAANSLAHSGVIRRERIDGDVVFAKVANMQGLKERVLKLVDDPSRIEKIATKRTPRIIGMDFAIHTAKKASDRSRKVRTPQIKMKPTENVFKVAVLASNSHGDLRTDIEVRRLLEEIKRSRNREKIDIRHFPAASLSSLLELVNEICPDCVHFSGHGSNHSLYLDGLNDLSPQAISIESVLKLVARTATPPKLVVLNSCYSSVEWKRIVDAVPAFIGMNAPIGDVTASVFASKFYGALISGQTLKVSFDQAVSVIQILGHHDYAVPELHCRSADIENQVLVN